MRSVREGLSGGKAGVIFLLFFLFVVFDFFSTFIILRLRYEWEFLERERLKLVAETVRVGKKMDFEDVDGVYVFSKDGTCIFSTRSIPPSFSSFPETTSLVDSRYLFYPLKDTVIVIETSSFFIKGIKGYLHGFLIVRILIYLTFLISSLYLIFSLKETRMEKEEEEEKKLDEKFQELLAEYRIKLERLEREKKEWERNKGFVVLGKSVSDLLHELRNSLGAIMSLSGLMEKKLQEKVKREVLSLNRLADDLLLLTRDYGKGKEKVNVKEIVEEVLEREVPEGYNLIKNLRSVYLYVNREFLSRAFGNIVKNAVEATKKGKKIKVKLSLENGDCVFRVKDEGKGMDRETLKRIFDPFFTTKKRGTGLGLSITRRIVEYYGGRIEVESKPGKGTTVTVRIPCQESSS
ncbi:hypothetical protein DRQ20_00595 [bacterium]|nr:MAG: hypothetical protein DRQ20_00595 [bacterium]